MPCVVVTVHACRDGQSRQRRDIRREAGYANTHYYVHLPSEALQRTYTAGTLSDSICLPRRCSVHTPRARWVIQKWEDARGWRTSTDSALLQIPKESGMLATRTREEVCGDLGVRGEFKCFHKTLRRLIYHTFRNARLIYTLHSIFVSS